MAADTEEARDRRLAVAERVLTEGSAQFLVDAMLPQLLGQRTRSEQPDVVDLVSGWIASARPQAVAWRSGRWPPARIRPRTWRPTRVRHCWRVTTTSSRHRPNRERIAATLSDTDLMLVPGVGHLSAIEHPEPVAAALIEWADVRCQPEVYCTGTGANSVVGAAGAVDWALVNEVSAWSIVSV